jgi:hypothetical protein
MKKLSVIEALCIAFGLILASVFAIPAHAANDQDTIDLARKAYYSLKKEGLVEFRCNVQPDWEAMLAGANADDATKTEVLPILKKTRFGVLVGPDGASSISHQSDAAPPNEEVAARIRSMTEGMDQILTGFFQTWSGFTINSIFPDTDTKFQLEDQGDKYRLTYGDGSSGVLISMSHDFAIEELKVTTAQFVATIQPQFVHEENGFLLTGYNASYKPASGDPLQLSVSIDNSDVEKLRLPRTVKATVPTPGGPLEIVLTFSDYQIKKR